jgi:hypothetical protein
MLICEQEYRVKWSLTIYKYRNGGERCGYPLLYRTGARHMFKGTGIRVSVPTLKRGYSQLARLNRI